MWNQRRLLLLRSLKYGLNVCLNREYQGEEQIQYSRAQNHRIDQAKHRTKQGQMVMIGLQKDVKCPSDDDVTVTLPQLFTC